MRQEGINVLLFGNGGRESALGWAIEESPLVNKFYCAPGNGGFAPEKRRHLKDGDFDGAVQLAKDLDIDLAVIGPEVWLVGGLVDRLHAAGIQAFGPTKVAAMLEKSKSYTKMSCMEYGIPTATWRWTNDFADAKQIILAWGSAPVIKYDDIYGGKGVVVTQTIAEAIDVAHNILENGIFGDATCGIVIEDRLFGIERSYMNFCDGVDNIRLPVAQDYKRALDGDLGKNTGGMGAFSPVPGVDDRMLADIDTRIIKPTLRGMAERGAPFHGLLYAGLMITKNGPYLLEYNVRFGDPETQVVIPRIKSDIVEYMRASLTRGGLANMPPLHISDDATVCTNLVAPGYPDEYPKGLSVSGLEEASEYAMLFHANTERKPGLVSVGGRIINCVGRGRTIAIARERSQKAAELVQIPNKFYRKDIAANISA